MRMWLSLLLLVTIEVRAMEVTRTVSSFTRSRVRFQYRDEGNQTVHGVVEARFAIGAPILPAVGVLGKPSSNIRACQNVSKLSDEVKIIQLDTEASTLRDINYVFYRILMM